MSALADLEAAAAALSDPDCLAEQVTRALSTACRRGLAYVYTLRGRGHPSLDAVHGRFDDGDVDLQSWRRAYQLGEVGYDRNAVDARQRHRWIEPLRHSISSADYADNPIYRTVARYGVFAFGRVLVCDGSRPVACVGVALPRDSPRFSASERRDVFNVARRSFAPLQLAARLADDRVRRAGLTGLLEQRDHATVVANAAGAVIEASTSAVLLLNLEPALRRAIEQRVRAGRTGTLAPVAGVDVSLLRVTERAGTCAFVVSLSPVAARELEVTPRQAQVLNLVAQGLTNRAIASHLGIEPSTVKTVLSRIAARVGCRGRAGLVGWWTARRPMGTSRDR